MNYPPSKLNRLIALERRAEARFNRVLQKGNFRLSMRAANFWTLVSGRVDAIVRGGVETFR